ncbi:MAG: GAF domain-containing protein, partial [Anaerolineae bacterium]|nr:GAF domain-containing protein [Anaerolineae bacterium]
MLPDAPRVHSRLDLLYLVTREFNTGLDINQLLNRVLTATVAAVGASEASLSLFDAVGRLEKFISINGFLMQQLPQEKIDVIQERGLVSWVKQHQQAILIDDLSHDERWYQNHPISCGSAMAVPIKSPDYLVGVLTITGSQPDYFDANDLSMLTVIADQAAFAIANARLFEKEQHRRRLADILASLAHTINSTLDLNEVLDLILKHLALVIDYDSSSILLYDEKARTLSVRAARGFDDMEDALKVSLVETNNAPNYRAITHKTPIVIGDVDQEPGWVKTSSSQNVHSW